MLRREALVLRAFCVWTVYVSFKAVHTVLAVISVGFAVVAWRIVSRNRRRTRDARSDRVVESGHEPS